MMLVIRNDVMRCLAFFPKTFNQFASQWQALTKSTLSPAYIAHSVTVSFLQTVYVIRANMPLALEFH